MSATINTIPASAIVNIVPSVLNAGGSALETIGLMLTNSNRVPIGQVLSFPSLTAVQNYFGPTSIEATDAAIYFLGFSGSARLPAALLVTQYNQAAVYAFLRGGSTASMTLAQLQALTPGTITVSINGGVIVSSTINLSSATSFANAAQLISNQLGFNGPTQASFTGRVGATFTGTGSGSTLTVASITGSLFVGDGVTGTGVPANTTIVAQLSGTPNSNGTYTTSAVTTASSAACVANSNTLVVTAVASGVLAVGQEVISAGLSLIAALGTGTGGIGTYTLSGAQQQLASTALTATVPACYYDAQTSAFVMVSSSTGATSTIGYASGALATSINLTQATGAVISPGANAASPIPFMTNIAQITQNWVSFWTSFDPDNGSGNANKLLFVQWTNSQNNRYLYAVDDLDITPTESNNASTSLGNICKALNYSGTAPIYQPAADHFSSFLCGAIASIDFTETNGRATMAFKSQTGLPIGVTNQTVSDNLIANGYNFYGAYATAAQAFQFFYPGLVSGPFSWIDSYINQIWLSNAMQLALMELLTQVKSIPYNPAGYGLIRSALADPITAALNFGAIRQNVPLSAEQAAIVNNQAGVTISNFLQTNGWYLQILAATAQVRAARQSPPMTLWYMDGESVQQITLASITIQ